MSLYHLDADYLISFAELFHDHHEKARSDVIEWLSAGHKIGTSAIAWREFYSGGKTMRPPSEFASVAGTLNARVVRFGPRQAEKSAELFNQTGRRKRLKSDCDVAATAILAKATLATFNIDDFKLFAEFGLRIANLVELERPQKNTIIVSAKRRVNL